MHELPYSRVAIRRALALCTTGRKVPKDTARIAYSSTESFWPSQLAYPIGELHQRVVGQGAEALSPEETRTYVGAVQLVNQKELERSKEFDLLVKWYEGLMIHLLKEERRLEAQEAQDLRNLLQDSIAGDAEWLSEVQRGLKEGGGSISVPEEATAEQVVEELNFINHDVELVRKLVDEIP